MCENQALVRKLIVSEVNMQPSSWMVSFAVTLGLIGCGVDVQPHEVSPTGKVEALSFEGLPVTEIQTPEPIQRGLSNPGGSEASRAECCHGQCRNDGGPWVGPWWWKRSDVSYGQCADTVRSNCSVGGFRYYHAYWDPCPR